MHAIWEFCIRAMDRHFAYDASMSSFSIVGVLNVTPNSYVDGGKYEGVDRALARASEMLKEGADIIEIGGESTGPNSPAVSLEEERMRVIPVIGAIRKAFPDARLSVDTYKASIAQEAIALGVTMVNDVTAGRGDPGLFSVVAASTASIVLMYAKDSTARTTMASQQYEDVLMTVRNFLAERIAAAEQVDIERRRIIIDPGLGHFLSSDARYSLEILHRLSELRELGCPIFLSPSRKSFLAGEGNLPVADRLPGTIAASSIAVLNGAEYIRTHDVLAVRRACEIAATVRDVGKAQ
ncbi:MAG: dihydropteroate synthase [Candidatus Peregrinibacteria bacterium]|nr:dihydropteroate synthase [Candidatus Peregrinibacteria bacterium]